MKESFLHFIWMHALFNHPLYTSDGQCVKILHQGYLNHDSGPDFLDARILIDHIQLVGHIEMHLKSSDWYHHGHHHDPAYENVLLHVVYEKDRDVKTNSGNSLPQIILKNQIQLEVLHRYIHLESANSTLPCMNMITEISSITREWITSRMIAERLEQRGELYRKMCIHYVNDLRSVLYTFTFRSFGGSINAEPMETLAGKVPLSLLQRIAPEPEHIEAVLFGQAGFLSHEAADTYQQSLKIIYEFYRKKFQLKPMAASVWKFHRTRPSNFPSLRLAQLAAFLMYFRNFTVDQLTLMEPGRYPEIFETVTVSSYWKDHYHFGRKATQRFEGKMSSELIRNLLINAWIPFLFHFGKQSGKTELTEKAIDWFYTLPSEKNHTTRTFEKLTGNMRNAAESQAFLHLYKYYCTPKKCAACQIGKSILCGKSP